MMKDWIKVVTDPMGLAGFALFLVFSFLGRKGTKKPGWLAAGAFAMACLALAGGLTLAYFRVRANPPAATPNTNSQPAPSPTTVNQQAIGEIKQKSTGNGAVNAAGVQGQFTVNNNSVSPTPTPQQQKKENGKK